MRRFYYFGCRGSDSGHYLFGDNDSMRAKHLDGGFPVDLLDGTFAPLYAGDRSWRLTHLRFDHHILSILACHDNTIDKRPGSNAAFVVIDDAPWDAVHILNEMRERFHDCHERLKHVPFDGPQV